MNFCWVTLPIKDYKKSLDFYHGLQGLPIDSETSIAPNPNIQFTYISDPDGYEVQLVEIRTQE